MARFLGSSIQWNAQVADVPADGYSVELGQLEKPDERGIILSTGQYIRFLATMAAGVVQAVLVNGPKTNASDCPIDVSYSLTDFVDHLVVGQFSLA